MEFLIYVLILNPVDGFRSDSLWPDNDSGEQADDSGGQVNPMDGFRSDSLWPDDDSGEQADESGGQGDAGDFLALFLQFLDSNLWEQKGREGDEKHWRNWGINGG